MGFGFTVLMLEKWCQRFLPASQIVLVARGDLLNCSVPAVSMISSITCLPCWIILLDRD